MAGPLGAVSQPDPWLRDRRPCPLLAVVSTGRRNTLSWREKMECSDGSGISSRVYNGREDGVMGSLPGRKIEPSHLRLADCIMCDLRRFTHDARDFESRHAQAEPARGSGGKIDARG